MQDALEVDRDALAADLATRWPRIGNLLVGVGAARARRTRCATGRRDPGSFGVLMAMGPGFCLELVLLQGWPE